MLYKALASKPWYPWLVVGLCLLTVSASNGLINNGLTVFDESLLIEFGWSISELKTRDSISFLCGAIFVLGAGYVVDKYGPKPLLLLGMALLAIGYFSYGRIESLSQLYSMHILFGMVLACAGNMTAIVTAASWVEHRRGLAVGLVIAGTSIGGILIPPTANYLNQAFGWRLAMQYEAIFPLLMMLLIFLLIKNRPVHKQTKSKRTQIKKELSEGVPLAQVLKKLSFYQVAIAGALTYFTVTSIFSHMFLYMRSLDYASEQASLALSTMALLALVGKLFSGYMSDRINPHTLFRAQMLCMLVGVLGTSQLNEFIWVFLLFTGFGWGGLHTLYNYILIALFGLRDAGKINSIVSLAEAAGAGMGIFVTGYLRDYFGNYPDALLVSAGLMTIATICVFAIKPSNAKSEQRESVG